MCDSRQPDIPGRRLRRNGLFQQCAMLQPYRQGMAGSGANECTTVQLTCFYSQFLLDGIGRCIKLFVLTDSTSCHEFASQFGLAYLLYPKNTQEISRRPTVEHTWLLLPATPVTMWSRLNRQLDIGAAVILSGDRFSQNSENQQVKTVTMRVYTFTA